MRVKLDDLVVIEFVKEARILQRQLKLMKNNIDSIEVSDLVKILNIVGSIEKEINDLKGESKGVLDIDDWEVHKSM